MKKYSFTSQERLHLDREFDCVFKQGKVYRHPAILLFVYNHKKNHPDRQYRLGLVVQRKVGSAVKRNQLKRRMREIFRLNKHLFKNGCIDMIFLPKKDSVDLNFQQLKETIFLLWHRAKVLNA